MSARHTEISANGMRFDALTAGPAAGELVMLLHGFPQTASCWRQALAALGSAGYHAVAPTQRGYCPGATPESPAAYRISELCSDVLAIAAALERERFHLVGHDWGGSVAWAVAGDHPEAVVTLTAMSTPHSAALRQALRGTRQRLQMAYIPVLRLPHVAESLFEAGGGIVAETLLTATGLSRAHARRDVVALRRVGPTGALNWYRALGTERPHAAPVSAPVLHAWGDRDPAFTREATELTAGHCTGPYHLVELTGGTHWIPDEHWDDVADLVLDHLEEHPVAAS